MKRFACACLLLVGLGLLILFQLGRLEALNSRLALLRKAAALAQLPRMSTAATAAAVKPAPPVRTARLEELVKKAHRVLGGMPLLHPEDLFQDYPQLETAFLASIEAHLRIKNGGYFAQAGFTEQQIARYVEICMKGERDWVALNKEAATRGVTLSDPAIVLLGRERGNQRKQEMAELLGPAGLALRERYSDERPARNALLLLAQAAPAGGQPLSFDQLNRLTAMTTELGVFDNDRLIGAVGLGGFARASGKAAEILTPEQQELFELLITARQADLLRALNRRKAQ